MLNAAIKLKDIVSSNVTALVDSAANPNKLLNNLQREIEATIVALEGDRAKAQQRMKDLEAQYVQNEMRAADWGDKAKTAMETGDEALARQALMAREDCRELLKSIERDARAAKAELVAIEEAIEDLGIKREDARQRAHDQSTSAQGGSVCASGSKTDKRLNKITKLQKRAEFARDDVSPSISEAAVSRDIEELRRKEMIEKELEAMRSGSAPAKGSRRKSK
ncbi:MAG: PspA/IM30 family protein [Pseudomonadota bacterium]